MPGQHPPPGDLQAVAALADPLRGRLYRLVRRQRRPVSRDQAATAEGISRGLAAFHLDKLVEVGLLRASYQPPQGRPPRVGRRPKVYEPSGLEVAITIPDRRYEALGEILVDAVAQAGLDERPLAAASRIARAKAVERGAALRRRRRLGRLGPERALTVAMEVAEQDGYEPYRRGRRTVALRNCPFQALARSAPQVVCTINRAVLEGLLRGLGDQHVEAVLAPRPGACCVELRAPPAVRRPGGQPS